MHNSDPSIPPPEESAERIINEVLTHDAALARHQRLVEMAAGDPAALFVLATMGVVSIDLFPGTEIGPDGRICMDIETAQNLGFLFKPLHDFKDGDTI